MATNLYRIAQEAVANAIRHGRAKSVLIQLAADNGKLTLRVRDDGRASRETETNRNGTAHDALSRDDDRRLAGRPPNPPARHGGDVLISNPRGKPIKPEKPRLKRRFCSSKIIRSFDRALPGSSIWSRTWKYAAKPAMRAKRSTNRETETRPCDHRYFDGGMNGIEFLKHLKTQFPELPALVLSMHDEALYAERALRAGALAFVMKKEGSEEVMTAIRKARMGKVHVSEKVGGAILEKLLNTKRSAKSPVSHAQRPGAGSLRTAGARTRQQGDRRGTTFERQDRRYPPHPHQGEARSA